MSRVAVWLSLSAAGLAYWAIALDFARAGVDHFTGPVWFGGCALLLHWVTNRTAGVSPSAHHALPPSGTDAWKIALLDELASCGMDAPLDESPASILRRVIEWHVERHAHESASSSGTNKGEL